MKRPAAECGEVEPQAPKKQHHIETDELRPSEDPASTEEPSPSPAEGLTLAEAKRRIRADPSDAAALAALAGVKDAFEGSVKSWSVETGTGLIREAGEPDGGALELPCKLKNVALVGFRALAEGRRVTFRVGADESGCACAVSVHDSKGAPIQNGLITGADSQSGKKERNEDRAVAGESCGPLGQFCGIYDGHGGVSSATYAAKHLHKIIQSRAGASAGVRLPELTAAVKEAFAEADRSILSTIRRENSSHKAQTSSSMRGDGTTALCVFVLESPATGALSALAAWAGDSRAVLVRGSGGGGGGAAGADAAAAEGPNYLRLTEDHKPGRVDEKLRLRAAGGIVENVRGVWRVARNSGVVKNKVWLACSRALGDIEHKEPTVLVSSEPDVKLVPLLEDDIGIVLGCDGIFDVLSDKDVADIALSFAGAGPGSAHDAAAAIVQTALRRGSGDNCTAVVAYLARRCATDASAETVAAVAALREAAARRVEEAERKANAPKEVKAVDEDLDMFA